MAFKSFNIHSHTKANGTGNKEVKPFTIEKLNKSIKDGSSQRFEGDILKTTLKKKYA